MIYVFFTLAAFLLLVAWFCWRDPRNRWMAVFLLLCAVLNAYCGYSMIAKRDPYAYRLHPNDGTSESDPGLPDRR